MAEHVWGCGLILSTARKPKRKKRNEETDSGIGEWQQQRVGMVLQNLPLIDF